MVVAGEGAGAEAGGVDHDVAADVGEAGDAGAEDRARQLRLQPRQVVPRIDARRAKAPRRRTARPRGRHPLERAHRVGPPRPRPVVDDEDVEQVDAGLGHGGGELLEPGPGARRPARDRRGRAGAKRQPDRARHRRGGGVAGGGGDHVDVVAGLAQRQRGGQPDDAGADHGDPRHHATGARPLAARSAAHQRGLTVGVVARPHQRARLDVGDAGGERERLRSSSNSAGGT